MEDNNKKLHLIQYKKGLKTKLLNQNMTMENQLFFLPNLCTDDLYA